MLWEKITKIEKQMKLSDAPLALTFDDVSLVPAHSTVKSRKEPDTTTVIGGQKYKVPIFASCMNTITEVNMAVIMSNLNAGAIVHRYMSIDDQNKMAIKVITFGCKEKVFFAVGATGDYLERTQSLYSAGVRKICVDVANGHSATLLNAVETLRKTFPDLTLMAGNVCDNLGAWYLASSGVNVIRVGIGSGGICKTRVVTGFGVPQMTALEDCVRVKEQFPNVAILADGGIRNSGDIIKSLAIGADGVVCGGVLAGTDETPGSVINKPTYLGNGQYKENKIKHYNGMASEAGRKFNGWFSEEDASFVPEGVSLEVPCKGPVSKVIENLVGGVKVGMSYAGARTLEELRKNAKWVRVSSAGYQEGLPRNG